MIGRARIVLAATVSAAVLAILAGCGPYSDPPLVQACLKAGAELAGISAPTPSLETCRCVDRTAKAELDPRAYEALSRAAGRFTDDRAATAQIAAAGSDATHFATTAGARGTGWAAVELMVTMHKAAMTCSR